MPTCVLQDKRCYKSGFDSCHLFKFVEVGRMVESPFWRMRTFFRDKLQVVMGDAEGKLDIPVGDVVN